ncbi:hypothetical protein [Aerolutibacter ruishenii]|uniref:DUF3619 family protein n=1 Tax=Aerolutibacter ruishenii TaxID=686800 RepID=A0A562M2M8_9GAMM|nr:hypothetical protein [Lysobacter ruishenii]TWI14038.1 hypothetical protein IP93_00029 [Lysobacter ruishenii]
MNANHTLDENPMAAPGDDTAFDARARACHGASLQRLSARTQARLAQARRPAAQPAPRHGAAWAVPTVFAAIAALAITAQLRTDPRTPPPATGPATALASGDTASSDPAAALDENPDFYLWLASADDVMPTNREY